MKLLLDTHVLLWWHSEPSRLSESANNAISDFDNEIFLSVVNGWEGQIKAQLGKLTLSSRSSSPRGDDPGDSGSEIIGLLCAFALVARLNDNA